MLPRGQNPTGQAAGRTGRPDRARLVWQAHRLHAAVRGVSAGHGPADDLCRGRQSGQRVLAPRACHLFALYRPRRDQADLSPVTAVAIDESACRRGHDYLTIAADADERKLVFVIEERDATTIARFAEHLAAHKARPEQITAVSIDMSPAFIRGVADHLPRARIT